MRLKLVLAACLLTSSAWAADPVPRAAYFTSGDNGSAIVTVGGGLNALGNAVPCGSSTVWNGCGFINGVAAAIPPITGSVSVSNFPTTQPVSGTVTTTPSGTQAVSGAVSISNLPTTQAVSGAFYQTTQPISGTVTTTPSGTQAVTGSFYQTTQPVSGAFYQSSQPVSDPANAAFQGVVVITPGTATTAQRSIGFICTTAGNVTLTLADASTMTLGIVVSTTLQTLPLAVTNIALGTGTAGTFWGLK